MLAKIPVGPVEAGVGGVYWCVLLRGARTVLKNPRLKHPPCGGGSERGYGMRTAVVDSGAALHCWFAVLQQRCSYLH